MRGALYERKKKKKVAIQLITTAVNCMSETAYMSETSARPSHLLYSWIMDVTITVVIHIELLGLILRVSSAVYYRGDGYDAKLAIESLFKPASENVRL